MKRITSTLLPLLTVVLAALFASCSSNSGHKILELIPSDATGVTLINLDRLKDAGVTPSELTLSRNMLPVSKGLVAQATLADGVTIGIVDAPAPDSLAATGFTASGEPEGSLTPYTNPDGLTAVVDSRSGMAYTIAMSAPRAMELVKNVTESASVKSFASNLGLANQFARDAESGAIIYGALSRSLIGRYTPPAGDPQSAQWIAFTVKQESDIASIDANLIEGSGKPVEIQGLQTISPDFLRYVPGDMNIVAAAGVTPDIDWDAAVSLIGMVASRSTAGYIAAATPYLKDINGTVAIAVGIDGSGSGTAMPGKFFAMARMERSKINDVVRQAGALAALGGASTEQVSETISLISLPEIAGLPSKFYIGEVDGNLVISSYLPDGKANNSFATAIEGHEAAAVATLPAGTLPAGMLPSGTGMDVKFALDATGVRVKAAFPGSDRKPLAVVASLFGL